MIRRWLDTDQNIIVGRAGPVTHYLSEVLDVSTYQALKASLLHQEVPLSVR